MAFYRFRPVLTAFWQVDGLPFANVLSEDTIQQAFAAVGLPTPADDPNDPTVYTPSSKRLLSHPQIYRVLKIDSLTL